MNDIRSPAQNLLLPSHRYFRTIYSANIDKMISDLAFGSYRSFLTAIRADYLDGGIIPVDPGSMGTGRTCHFHVISRIVLFLPSSEPPGEKNGCCNNNYTEDDNNYQPAIHVFSPTVFSGMLSMVRSSQLDNARGIVVPEETGCFRGPIPLSI